MTEQGPLIERFLERVTGLGATASLHPSRLLHEVVEAARGSIRDGAIANAYRVLLAPADAAFFLRHEARLKREIEALLGELATERGARTPGPWVVELAALRGAPAGTVRVAASFRNPASEGARPVAGATQAIKRHRGKYLVVEGAGRVALTHTPFVIGRGRECDLSVPDLAISRRHARIETLPDGQLLLRDLGSRNRLKVHGGMLDEVVLVPGLVVEVGSTKLSLEVEE